MSRNVLTRAQLEAVIAAGGAVLYNCGPTAKLITNVSELPSDDQLLLCFPLSPPPSFDEDDMSANAIGILGKFFTGSPNDGDTFRFNSTTNVWEFVPYSGVGSTNLTFKNTGQTAFSGNKLEADISSGLTVTDIGSLTAKISTSNIPWANINKSGSSLADLANKSASDLTTGTLSITRGGTGLNTISGGKFLFAHNTNVLSEVALGTGFSIISNTLEYVDDSSNQKVRISNNNTLQGSRREINFIPGANTTVSTTDDPTNNRVNVTINASGTLSGNWHTIGNPTADLTLNHGNYNTIFSWSSSTGSNNLFTLADSNNNTGTGHILAINSATGSSAKPIKITSLGTANGVEMDTNGLLYPVGTGSIRANDLSGITGNGIITRTSSGNFINRIIASGSNITITNQDGVSGNPTINLGANVVTGVSNDTNIQGNISSNTLTFTWNGVLAKNRQNAETVYKDQANIYSSGSKQTFTPNSTNAGMNVGTITNDPSTLVAGDIWFEASSNKFKAREAGNTVVLNPVTEYRKSITVNGSALSILEVSLPNLTACAGVINYAIIASDGTNIQMRSGSIRYSAVNKSGVYTSEKYVSSEGISPSGGTLTADWNIFSGTNKITVSVTPNTSLTFTTYYIKYSVQNLSDQQITIL